MSRRLACNALVTALAAATIVSAAHAQQQPPPQPVYEGMTRRGMVSPDAGPPPLPAGVTAPAMPGGGPGGPPPGGMPPPGASMADTKYDSALRIVDGAYDPARSQSALVRGGRFGDTLAKGIQIESAREGLNGVLVNGGASALTLSDARVALSGTGSNDFLGIGAGAMVTGGVMVLRNVKIEMTGAVRSATVANDHAVMKVYDSTIVAHGGPLPAGYVHHIGPGMMEAPAPLGITGTARANLTMGQSESYFYHSTITADGWGALSTDATGGYVYLEANDCDIRVNNSGYGAYADGGAHVSINKSRMDAATYGAIAAGSGEVRFTDVVGRAGRDAIMIHSVMGNVSEVGRFWFTGGSFETKQAAVLVKSANADIVLDHVALHPANGVLVQAIVNDDANRTRVNGQTVVGTTVSLKNGSFAGSLINQDGERGMSIRLTAASLAGAVQNATLSLDAASKWTATADSVVRLDSVAAGSLDARAGVTIVAHLGGGAELRSATLASGGRLVVR